MSRHECALFISANNAGNQRAHFVMYTDGVPSVPGRLINSQNAPGTIGSENLYGKLKVLNGLISTTKDIEHRNNLHIVYTSQISFQFDDTDAQRGWL